MVLISTWFFTANAVYYTMKLNIMLTADCKVKCSVVQFIVHMPDYNVRYKGTFKPSASVTLVANSTNAVVVLSAFSGYVAGCSLRVGEPTPCTSWY